MQPDASQRLSEINAKVFPEYLCPLATVETGEKVLENRLVLKYIAQHLSARSEATLGTSTIVCRQAGRRTP